MKKKRGRPVKEKKIEKIKIKKPVGRPRKFWYSQDTQILGSPIPKFLETPASETPAPETSAPETPAPETPAPETPAPETPAPETPDPETQKNFTKEELDKLFEHDIIEDVKVLEEKDIELEKLIDSRKLSVVAFNCIAILRNKDFWNLTEKESVLAGRILDYLMIHYKDKLKPYIVIIILSSGFLSLIGSRLIKDISEELDKKKEKKENKIIPVSEPKENKLNNNNNKGFQTWNSVNPVKY